MKRFLIEMNEYLNKKVSKPGIFTHTIYREPTDEELLEVNNFRLSPDELLEGFSYTMIGRGILWQEQKSLIVNSIKRLCDKYPDNINYQIALEKANELKLHKI